MTSKHPPQSQAQTTATQHDEATVHRSRLRIRRRTDSFFSRFSSSAPIPDIPDTHEEEPQGVAKVTAVLLTSLYLVSYLFSLLYVSRQNNTRRAALSSNVPDSFPDEKAHHQEADTGAWKRPIDGDAHKGWFVRKKHRMVVGMEMEEAEKMKGAVMGGIVIVTVAVLGMAGYAAFWGVDEFVRRFLHGYDDL